MQEQMRAYIFKLGFLDGYPGFYIAHATAFAALAFCSASLYIS